MHWMHIVCVILLLSRRITGAAASTCAWLAPEGGGEGRGGEG